MSTTIRPATEHDIPQLLPLMRALAEFEHYLDVFTITEDVLREQGDALVGILVYYPVPFTTPSLLRLAPHEPQPRRYVAYAVRMVLHPELPLDQLLHAPPRPMITLKLAETRPYAQPPLQQRVLLLRQSPWPIGGLLAGSASGPQRRNFHRHVRNVEAGTPSCAPKAGDESAPQ